MVGTSNQLVPVAWSMIKSHEIPNSLLPRMIMLQYVTIQPDLYTVWLFNIAMEKITILDR